MPFHRKNIFGIPYQNTQFKSVKSTGLEISYTEFVILNLFWNTHFLYWPLKTILEQSAPPLLPFLWLSIL